MTSFDDLNAKQQEQKAEPDRIDVPVVFGGELVTLRFSEIPDGTVWAGITSRNPADPEAPTDRYVGYDVHDVCQEAAPISGVYLDGDTETVLTPEQWQKMLTSLSGPDFVAVCDAIFGLNEWNPRQLTERLKKASIAASTVKLASLENSVSASEGSTGGNRAARRRTSTTKKADSSDQ
ncbi:hypothetical protein B7R22_05345 [Subtercola boreus]|uniref:Tail assembly chaperone n=1 Tax=Subtercola boreus TaxID=120213 RepID=A0A3E0W2V1_9MICO|nr:hypothetical protein [Subtercola boreus]RFA15833.1 hypothetical protein B7R22_05345 [Subtercola boreus]